MTAWGVSPGCSVQLQARRLLAFSNVRINERDLLPIIRLPREKEEAVGPFTLSLCSRPFAQRGEPVRG